MRDSVKFDKIIRLHLLGHSYRAIARLTTTSVSAVARAIAHYKKLGLLKAKKQSWFMGCIDFCMKKISVINPFNNKPISSKKNKL